jgi:hypothetical protein
MNSIKYDLGGNQETGYVRCNNCNSVYSEEGYGMEMFEDEGGFFKGCSVCKTDEYLTDITEEEFYESLT